MKRSDRIVWGGMAALFVIAYAVLVLAMIPPAKAAEAQSAFKDPACPTIEEVVLLLTKQGEQVVILTTQDVLGVKAQPGSGRILMSTFGNKTFVVVGYEQGGCVVGPTPVAKVVPETSL